MNLHSLQLAAIVLVLALVFLSRFARGRARETPAGLAFPIKPLVIGSRILAIVIYFFLFAYPLWISRQSIPAWLLFLLLFAVVFGLYQLPGTVVLTPDAVTQRFWFRSPKHIPYHRILRVAGSPNAQVTRVFGPDGVLINHTFNHADPQRFRNELSTRSGKPFAT